MAGSAVDVIFRLIGDTSKFSSAINKAQTDAGSLAQKMQATGKIMQNVGRAMTLGFTLPIVAGLGLAVKAGLEEQKQMQMLSKIVRQNTGVNTENIRSLEKWITTQQSLTNFSDGELRPAVQALSVATKDLAEAQDLTTVAMDIAAARGLSVEKVAIALSKAHDGNVGALGRLGIATKDTEGKMLTFEQAVKKARDAYGGAAQRGADPWTQMKNAIDDLVETVGKLLIPALTTVAGKLKSWAEWVNNLSPAWQKFGLITVAVVAAIGPLLWMFGLLIPLIGALTATVTIAGVQMSLFAALMTPMILSIGAIVLAIGALIAIFVLLYLKNDTVRKAVDLAWKFIRIAVGTAVSFVVGKIKDYIKWIVDLWQRSERLQAVVKLAWGLIKTVVALNVKLIVAELKAFWTMLKFIWDKMEPFRSAVAKAWRGLSSVAKIVWNEIVGFFSNGYDRVTTWIDNLIRAINKLLTSLHITPLPYLNARRGGGGTFGASTSAAGGRTTSTGRVSTPAIMDNGGVGVAPGGARTGGAGGGVSDWVGDLMGKIGWPSQPGGFFGGITAVVGDKVKEAVKELLIKWGGPGRQIVEYAKSRIGDPYVWGGSAPGGFDCSGLIYWAYQQAGKSIPRTGMWNAGRLVGPGQVRPADVGFFYPHNSQGVKYGHVKMYAGGGQAIESASGGVHMSPWGGASEIRTYLATGGVYVGEKGPEAVLPLSDKKAMAKLAKAGIGGNMTYHDNRQINIIWRTGSGSVTQSDVRRLYSQISALEGKSASAARRGSVR